jgi:hypothetical protein
MVKRFMPFALKILVQAQYGNVPALLRLIDDHG